MYVSLFTAWCINHLTVLSKKSIKVLTEMILLINDTSKPLYTSP